MKCLCSTQYCWLNCVVWRSNIRTGWMFWMWNGIHGNIIKKTCSNRNWLFSLSQCWRLQRHTYLQSKRNHEENSMTNHLLNNCWCNRSHRFAYPNTAIEQPTWSNCLLKRYLFGLVLTWDVSCMYFECAGIKRHHIKCRYFYFVDDIAFHSCVIFT